MARFCADTKVGRLDSWNVRSRMTMLRSRAPSNLPTFQRFIVPSVFRMCKYRPHEIVEELRLRCHVAFGVGVDVPTRELVQRRGFFVGEVQDVPVPALAR